MQYVHLMLRRFTLDEYWADECGEREYFGAHANSTTIIHAGQSTQHISYLDGSSTVRPSIRPFSDHNVHRLDEYPRVHEGLSQIHSALPLGDYMHWLHHLYPHELPCKSLKSAEPMIYLNFQKKK